MFEMYFTLRLPDTKRVVGLLLIFCGVGMITKEKSAAFKLKEVEEKEKKYVSLKEANYISSKDNNQI